MGRTTNYGQLNIFQGDPPAVVGNVATPVGASAPPTRPSDRLSKRAVLYWTSPWLDSGTWEQRVVDAVKAAKPGLLCVELNEKNLVSPDIGAIVLVISSAKFPQVKRRALTQLRLAKSHRPLVRVIMAAVGPSDQPLQYDDGVQLLRTAGYTSDTTRFLICDTEEDLEMKLLSQIQVAIKVGTDQADLELMINSASDQEIQT